MSCLHQGLPGRPHPGWPNLLTRTGCEHSHARSQVRNNQLAKMSAHASVLLSSRYSHKRWFGDDSRAPAAC